MLNMVAQLIPKLVRKFNEIPESPDRTSGTRLISNYTKLIRDVVQDKNPNQIVDDHATPIVFDCTKPPCTPQAHHGRRQPPPGQG